MREAVSLRDYVDQRFDAQDKAVGAALAAQEKAVAAALAAQEKAVSVAEANAKSWREAANEWRGAMTDKDGNYVTRKELWGLLSGIVGLIGAIGALLAFLGKTP